MILALSWLLHYYLSWREPCVKMYMLYIPKLISFIFYQITTNMGAPTANFCPRDL